MSPGLALIAGLAAVLLVAIVIRYRGVVRHALFVAGILAIGLLVILFFSGELQPRKVVATINNWWTGPAHHYDNSQAGSPSHPGAGTLSQRAALFNRLIDRLEFNGRISPEHRGDYSEVYNTTAPLSGRVAALRRLAGLGYSMRLDGKPAAEAVVLQELDGLGG